MNTKCCLTSLKLTAIVAFLTGTTNVRALTPTAPVPAVTLHIANGPVQFEFVAFGDSAEAGMLHRAYHILATGDHDYKGHRVRAMHQIEAAAKLLGLDLSGDLKDKESQPLSDARLREAEGLLQNVLGNAEVKNQPRVTKHIQKAISDINEALAIK